jgi:hypothetical protein
VRTSRGCELAFVPFSLQLTVNPGRVALGINSTPQASRGERLEAEVPEETARAELSVSSQCNPSPSAPRPSGPQRALAENKAPRTSASGKSAETQPFCD